MNSKSWTLSNRESKPPAARASSRRTASRWPTYITPQKSVGDQSGFSSASPVDAVRLDVLLVGVDRVERAVVVQRGDDLEQRVAMELVVVVEHRDELAARLAQRGVRRLGDAAVRGPPHDADPRVPALDLLELEVEARRGRAVVRDHELPLAIRLGSTERTAA